MSAAVYPVAPDRAPDGVHLERWRYLGPYNGLTLDLWSTSGNDLAWRLSGDHAGELVEGREFRPAPSLDHDSDESAGALVGFLASYAETLRYSQAEEPDVPAWAVEARDFLEVSADDLAMWSCELEGRLED